ncbi:MAG: pilus assembly protein, partial [Rudaea sp.]
NLNSANYQLPSNAIISELIDTSACTSSATANPVTIQQSGAITTPPNCYRSAFYNWIFQVPAGGGTPTRSTVNRAGIFFTRGNGNTGATGNLTDPYWQPPISGTGSGNELYCRQNYHMLVTDGLWNGGTNGPSYSSLTLPASGLTLPDGVAFPDPTTSGVTSIYNPVHDGGDAGYASLSDIAFNFWAKDLRSDLYKPTANPPQIVAPYMPDQSTGVFNLTGNVGSTVPQTNVNPEIYFNPFNDSATWPHMDEFLVGLGVNGQLNISQNTDCTNTTSGAKQDACLLRKGQTNSSGSVGWPTPNGQGGGIAANVDDTWHAGLAGRGEFFSAGDPQALIKALVRFLANINARAGTSVALTTSISVATASTAGFSGGYNSDWSGNLPEYAINPTTGQSIPPAVLDAGCILTGTGTGSTMPSCTTTATINTPQQPTPYTSRNIYTYASASTPTQAFSKTTFLSLNAADQCALNNGTWIASTGTCTGGDGYGPQRVDWLDGNRTYETATSPPQFRSRSSLLGAIIDAQPQYVGSPGGNYSDSWPAGSPEMASGAQTYSAFVKAIGTGATARPPIIYAAANDGMLHAFSAGGVNVSSTGVVSVTPGGGVEKWAYVPQTVIQNGAVTAYANSTGGLVPTVDGNFSTQDVFFTSDKSWHTILVGTLRYGGRGAFALDITSGTNPPKVLWDISNNSPGMADLGYTYSKPDITRLNFDDGTFKGKWVVLLPSGYMPTGSTSTDPATTTESIFVLDAETGTVIKELSTASATQAGAPSAASSTNSAYGLSTPTVWGSSNNVGLIAAAGDLMGNLWRFDLSDTNSANWKVDWMFQTPIPSGSGATRTMPAQQPITVEPNAMSDPNNGGNPIWIFGTGKYLSPKDNVSSAPTQAFYGIRDYGTGSSKYPISASNLVMQTLFESSNGIRAITQLGVNTTAGALAPGWTFNLIDSGERVVVTGTPLYSAGDVVLTTLIPTNNNPCQPGLTGAIMVVSATTGGAPSAVPPVNGGGYTPPNGTDIIGKLIVNPPIAGNGTPVVTPLGGGVVLIPGMPGFNISDSFWHRHSWRDLLDQL